MRRSTTLRLPGLCHLSRGEIEKRSQTTRFGRVVDRRAALFVGKIEQHFALATFESRVKERISQRKTPARIFAGSHRVIAYPVFQTGVAELMELRIRVVKNAPAMLQCDTQAKVDI